MPSPLPPPKPSSKPQPPRSSTGKVEYNVHNAALIGASSAFGGQARTLPPGLAAPRANAALAAATQAQAGKTSATAARTYSASSNSSVEKIRTQTTGSTINATPSPPSSDHASSPGLLDVPFEVRGSTRSKSPSNLAATLAAARRVSRSRPTSATRPYTAESRTVRATPSREAVPLPGLHKDKAIRQGCKMADKPTDDTSIAPTTSLVKLFEQNSRQSSSSNAASSHKAQNAPSVSAEKPSVKPQPTPKPAPKQTAITGGDGQERLSNTSPELPRRSTNIVARDAKPALPSRVRPSSMAGVQITSTSPVDKLKPNLPPPRRVTKGKDQQEEPTKSSPPKTAASKPQPPPPRQIRRPASNPALAENHLIRSSLAPKSQFQQRSMKQISPHMTGSSLANAIVGANLASRGTSPSRSSTPGVANRNRRDHDIMHQFRPSRSTSPTKTKSPTRSKPVTLRTTMRKDASFSSDEGRGKHGRGRKHFMRKHPHKHHEGSRKRWRDRVTEHERKRYEGLWAANKALHLAYVTQIQPGAEDDVLDLVVRDVWSRSRLPPPVLEEIWDLVDRRRVRRLSREEFVVGLWLVDQSLKGRKVPSRVTESVWASVRLAGVKVKNSSFQ